MATTSAYEGAMTSDDQELLKQYGDAYNAAKAAGNTAGMTDAHNKAETVRSSYGYTGGVDGSQYNSTQQSSESSYIDALTEAQRQANIASLKSAYDSNTMTLDSKASKLAGTYDTARNDAYTQSEINRANWNEYASGAGLNSGTGGQADLATNNALQKSISDISKSQAAAQADIDLQKAQLEMQYKNAIQDAIANGELDRANQLYELAQTRADTMAGIGDYSGYSQFGYSQSQIDALTAAYQAAQAASTSSSSGSSSSGGSSGGNDDNNDDGNSSSDTSKSENRTIYVSGYGYMTKDELSTALKGGSVKLQSTNGSMGGGGFIYVG